MSAQIFHLEGLQKRAGSKSLSVIADEYSVKVTSATDPHFWVRVKKTDTPNIIVTDFNPGHLPQVTLNIALREAVAELFAPDAQSIIFKNVIAVTPQDNEFSATYEGPVNAIRAACEGFARFSQKAISSFRVVPDGQKLNVEVAMS
jgi:hypothetical protein